MSFRQRPAVVIVEDAHWADDASLDIIGTSAGGSSDCQRCW